MTAVDPQRWALLSPQLDALMDLPSPERAGRLAELRVGNAALADELAALLTEMDSLDDATFMRHTPGIAQGPPSSGRIGDLVGAYRLERLLGEGGMGSVWLGRRIDGRYEGLVAIKFLRGGLVGPEHAQRFIHEGQLLGRLDHPNVARLLDAGLMRDTGQPYLVLEHVEGLPIDQHCDALALALRPRLLLFMDVLAAVAHAHERLILHRDLKPANILVTAKGQVKLLDFGIAKPLADAMASAESDALPSHAPLPHPPPSVAPLLTSKAFTPLYAAPEQLQGVTGDAGSVAPGATTATDVYALGVLLYSLLSGHHPTAAPGMTAQGRLQAVAEVQPRPVSEVVLDAGGPQARPRARALRGDLDTVVAKALKKQPGERYRNAAELADDLRRYLNHEPVTARPDGAAYRAAKFVRRHRLGVAAASTVALALAVGAGVALLQAREADAQRARAEQQRLQAEGMIEFMLGDLREKLEPVGRLDVLDAVASRALAYYDGQATDPLDADALGRRARALKQLGLLETDRQRLDEAERHFDQAAQITARLAARFPQHAQRIAEHGDSLGHQATIAEHRLRLEPSLNGYRQALAWHQRAVALQPGDAKLQLGLANAWVELGIHLVNADRQAEALAPLNEGLALMLPLAKVKPELWKEVVNIRSTLGDAYYGLSRYAQAVAVLQPHWTALTDVPGGDKDRVLQMRRAQGMNRMAGSLLRLGQVQQAERVSREAVSQTETLVALDPANLDLLNTLCHQRLQWAEVRLAAGDRPGARVLLAQIGAELDRLLAADPNSENLQFGIKGWLLELQAAVSPDDPATAPALQTWLDTLVPSFEARATGLDRYSRSMAAWVGVALGDLRAAQGRPAEARRLWQRARQQVADAAAGGTNLAVTQLARATLRLGDVAGAATLAAKLQAAGYGGRSYDDLLRGLAARSRP